jgi:hypothetical protein
MIRALLTGLVLVAAVNGQRVPPEVTKAAQDGLPKYLRGALAVAKGFGFDKGDSIQHATLGEPFQVFSVVSPDTFQRGISCKSVAKVSKKWFFPVLMRGEAKTVLEVFLRKDGIWEAAGIGGTAIAKSLGAIRARWPLEKGYDPYLIDFPPFHKTYFTVPEVDDYNLTEVARRRAMAPKNGLTSQSDSTMDSTASEVSVGSYGTLGSIEAMIDSLNPRIIRDRGTPTARRSSTSP